MSECLSPVCTVLIMMIIGIFVYIITCFSHLILTTTLSGRCQCLDYIDEEVEVPWVNQFPRDKQPATGGAIRLGSYDPFYIKLICLLLWEEWQIRLIIFTLFNILFSITFLWKEENKKKKMVNNGMYYYLIDSYVIEALSVSHWALWDKQVINQFRMNSEFCTRQV